MLRSLCKYPRNCWFKSWKALNSQTDNLQQCEKQEIHQIVPSPLVKGGLEKQESKKENESKHKCEFDFDGFWFVKNQLHFWEAVGLGTVFVAGIRFTIEYEKQKREGTLDDTNFITNPLHKAKLFLQGDGSGGFGLKSFDLQFLFQTFIKNEYDTRWSVLPQNGPKQKSILFGELEKVKNEVVVVLPVNEETNKKVSQINPQQEVLELKVVRGEQQFRSNLSDFLPIASQLSFFNSPLYSNSVRKTFPVPIKEPIIPPVLSVPSSASSEKVSAILNLLNELKEELLANEKCSAAAKLARRDEFKKATRIWNQIIESHPCHVKSLYNLAVCYENGLWLKKNTNKAVELYERAAGENHPRSCYRLARIHLRKWKEGSTASLQSYQDYLSKAAANGSKEAQGELEKFVHDREKIGRGNVGMGQISSHRPSLSETDLHCTDDEITNINVTKYHTAAWRSTMELAIETFPRLPERCDGGLFASMRNSERYQLPSIY